MCEIIKQKFKRENGRKYPCCTENLQPYTCTICNYATHFKVIIKNHHHFKPEAKLPETIKSYSCNECDLKINSVLLLIKHKEKCIKENQNRSNVALAQEPPFDDTERTQLNKKDNKPKLELCNLCPYTCNRGYLWRHIKSKHLNTNPKRFCCDQCDYATNHKGCLKKHIFAKQTSSDTKNWFGCEYCPFRAKFKDGLTCHASVCHYKPKKYTVWFKCEACDYKALTRQRVQKHEVIHQRPDALKWLQCDQCEFKTRTEKQLQTHIYNKHTDSLLRIKCGLCPYKSTHKGALQRHVFYKHGPHQDSDYFKCAFCPFNTLYKNSLKKHMAIKHLQIKSTEK